MPNEALEEIRRLEAALGVDVTRGRDFPTVDPSTGRWTGLTPPELPARARAAAVAGPSVPPPTPTSSSNRGSGQLSPRPRRRSRTVGPTNRRQPGQTLPTIDEIRTLGGYEPGGLAPPPAARGPPLQPLRLIGLPSSLAVVGRRVATPLPPPPPTRLPPPRPTQPPPPLPVVAALALRLGQEQQQQQQQQQERPAAVTSGGEEDFASDSSSDYGQGSQQRGRRARARASLRGFFSGLGRRGSNGGSSNQGPASG